MKYFPKKLSYIFIGIVFLLITIFGLFFYFFPQREIPPTENTIYFASIASYHHPNESTFEVTPAQKFQPSSLDIALALEYAKSLDKTANFKFISSLAELKKYLLDNPGVIGIGLSSNNFANQEDHKFQVTQAFSHNVQKIITNKNSKIPNNFFNQNDSIPNTLINLQKSIIYISSNNPSIHELLKKFKNYPNVEVMISNHTNFEIADILKDHPNHLAVVNVNDIPLIKLVFSKLKTRNDFEITTDNVWAFTKKSKTHDISEINRFRNELSQNNRLKTLIESFAIKNKYLDNLDLQYFDKRIKRRLFPLIDKFKSAANETEQSWTLLSALSYQESQWDNNAISSTGARGLMMINQVTAQQLKISQDDPPTVQINAGAKYLKLLRDDLRYVKEPDRTLIALAAYNTGPGAINKIIKNIYHKNLQDYPKSSFTEKGKYIKSSLPKSIWLTINWPEIRKYITDNSKLGRISAQPVILTERIRIFERLLNELDKYGYLHKSHQ